MRKNFFKNLIAKQFSIEKKDKIQLAESNLRRLFKSLIVFGIFEILNIVDLYIRFKNNFDQVLIKFYYYLSFSILSVATILVILIIKKINPKSYFAKMIPSYLSFSGFILINVFFLHLQLKNSIEFFNHFTVFACILFIALNFFYIEPIFYFVILTAGFIFVNNKLTQNLGSTATFDYLVFNVIMIIIAAVKWHVTKIDISKNNKILEFNKTLKNEINLAAVVQDKFFYQDFGKLDGWEYGFYHKAMAGVSGDFFDIYKTENKLDGAGIFDVSGHGISSGLVTMLVKNIISQEFYENPSEKLDSTMDIINSRVIDEKGNIENYLTGILLRTTEDGVDLVNAGHPQPFIYSKATNSAVEYSNTSQKRYGAIGLSSIPTKYTTEHIPMQSGDEILLFTDGILDCLNPKKQEFGKERLVANYISSPELSPQQKIDKMITSFIAFTQSEPLRDDITLLLLRKK